jgi:hypothetical protein
MHLLGESETANEKARFALKAVGFHRASVPEQKRAAIANLVDDNGEGMFILTARNRHLVLDIVAGR